MDLTAANAVIEECHTLFAEKRCNPFEGSLKTGVDLGTANIVISVVDENNSPVATVLEEASVVRDGVVVDYIGATRIVQRLKDRIEQIVGRNLDRAACAIPPGIIEGNIKVIANVVESADFEVDNVVDEPTAAATVLGIRDGAVVDVGGGTTGISIIKDGQVVYTADEATGGTHMSLVLAGFYKISFEEAETMKKKPEYERDVFNIVKPVVQKMASIVKRFIQGYDVETIYVVGGACCFKKFESVFEHEIGVRTIKPAHPLLVTPLGIAMNCRG
ncbi:MAG: ethanolamine utilization protein EutJ [Bacillota bacterium]